MDTNFYETCDPKPYIEEIIYRMHECRNQGQALLNLSYTHPRSYLPNPILRRPAVRKLLDGWRYMNDKQAPTPYPTDRVFLAPQAQDLTTDPPGPYEQEIAVRQYEAELEAYNKALATGEKQLPIMDLTNFHPRGGIPPQILTRLERRKNREWRNQTLDEISRLLGEVNKGFAFAKTLEERGEGLASKGGDPSKLQAAAEEERRKARACRTQADFLGSELGAAP